MEASGNLLLDSMDSDQATETCQVSEEEEHRRSGRPRNNTEKMLAFQREEAHKKEKKLTQYEQWKTQARKAREQLKSDLPESEIAALINTLEKGKDNVINIYMEIRAHLVPSGETRRRIDACEAVTKDIVKIAYERIAGIDGDFDGETVKQQLCELLKRDYARSIYGSTASPSSKHSSCKSSKPSMSSIVAAKRADAAAELAAKEAEYEVVLKEEKQKERIQLLEEQQKKELEFQKSELERLKAEKDVKAARARLEVYNQEVMLESSGSSRNLNTRGSQHVSPQQPVTSSVIQQPMSPQQPPSAVIQQPVSPQQPPTSAVIQQCMFCQDSKHRLYCCPEFKEKSLDERRKYVKEKKLLWLPQARP